MKKEKLELKRHEREIIGHHFLYKGKMVADDQAVRVLRLTNEYLEYITDDETGWNTLYRDPNDGRYWEKSISKANTMAEGQPP